MDRPRIFIASGNDKLREELPLVLERCGCAISALPEKPPDLVLMFYSGGPAAYNRSPADEASVVQFLTADASDDAVLRNLEAAVHGHFRRQASFRAENDTKAFAHLTGGNRLIGDSLQMRELRESIHQASASDANVLITGETGTGKELVAQLIQQNSTRRSKPFLCVNCAAIPDSLLESELFGYERGAFTGAHAARAGKLELAHGGTIFFDEIGDMSPLAQAKILRAIESKDIQRLGGTRTVRVDVRIIAATNQELDVPQGDRPFRRDLYFRLNVARIHLVPLRERKADIPLLIRHFIVEMNHQFGRTVEGLSTDAIPHLLQYNWPGNVRELRNVLECMFVNLGAGPVRWMQLPERLRQRIMGIGAVVLSEQERLLDALWSTGWNKSKVARKLEWSRMTVYRKMAKYKLSDREPKLEPASKPLVRSACEPA